MNGHTRSAGTDVADKIARLVREHGWNQEDFARQTQLNRQTVRQILVPHGVRRLRNATIQACAQALGLSVNDLESLPVEELQARLSLCVPKSAGERRRLYEEATQPALRAWKERHPERARSLTDEEYDELLSIQGTGGPLSLAGVEHFVSLIERRRELLRKVLAIAGTDMLDVLEGLVGILYDKVCPYRDRA